MDAIFFPKGQNRFFLVYGCVFFGENELKVNSTFDFKEDAISYYNRMMAQFPDNADIGIQEHIVNKVNV